MKRELKGWEMGRNLRSMGGFRRCPDEEGTERDEEALRTIEIVGFRRCPDEEGTESTRDLHLWGLQGRFQKVSR